MDPTLLLLQVILGILFNVVVLVLLIAWTSLAEVFGAGRILCSDLEEACLFVRRRRAERRKAVVASVVRLEVRNG